MPAISVLIKPASSMCNMDCRYCFYCDESKKRQQASFGFMSEDTLRNVIRKTMLAAQGSITYAYQGGEPSLRGLDFFKRAIEYQKQYNKNHISVHNTFQTNGYALDEKWCRFFKENHFLVGLSVDGTEKIHNSLRRSKMGADTFAQVEAFATLMDRYEVDYNVLTVVTAPVAEHIDEIYHFYKKKGWLYQQYIACLDPLQEIRGQKPYSLLPEAYGQFLVRLFGLWYADLLKGQQPFIRQLENYIAIASGYQPESCEQRGTCGIQNVVEADGSVYPCDFYVLDSYYLGNYNKCRQEEIDRQRNKLGFMERSLHLDPQCRDCSFYALCRGGCQRNRELLPDTVHYKNYFCPAYKLFFEHCAKQIYEISRQLSQN